MQLSVQCRLCSLIPGLGVKLSTIILAGPTVLSAVGACPPHDGVRRRWRTNVASAVVLLDARKKSDDLTTATVPAVRENPVISLSALRSNLFLRPVELGSVDPHAMQDDCELARDSDASPFRRRMLALSAWHAQNVAAILRKVRFMSLACWSH